MARPLAWLSGSALLLALLLTAPAAQAEVGNEKALRYHSVLVKRPSPGYLYDRFYNTWLDTGTLDELREFLAGRVEDEGGAADRLLLAFFYSKGGEDVKALQQFRAALEKDPGNAQLWYHKATIEARTLDFETAIADLKKASESAPDEKLSTAIAKLQGKLYVRNRQTAKAIVLWKKLLDAHPGDEELHEDIIELQISEGLYDEAAKLSEALIRRTEDKYKQVIRRVRTGDIYQRAGQRSKALDVYSSTLEQVGHGVWLEREILAQIENLFRREDDLTGLQKHYEKLLEDYSKRIQVHKQYAKLLSELGEDEAALKQFEEILRLTPGDRGNVEAYVALLSQAGKLPEAIAAMAALIQQNPRDGELQLRLARLHHQAKDSQAAAQAISDYLAASDKSEYAHLRAARMLQQLELKDEAESAYAALAATFPESSSAQEARAAFLYDHEKKDEALAIWRKLAEGKGRSELVQIARVLASRNEHQQAFDLLSARSDEFQSDAIFLGQLVREAIVLEKHEQAIPWTLKTVQLARTANDLENAIIQAGQVAKKADQTQSLIKRLTALPRRSVQGTCLLAELYEQTGDSRRADEALAKLDDQNDLLAISQQVRLHTQRRDWAKAAEATQRLVKTPQGRKSIYVRRLVELYQRDLKYSEALRWTQEWKKLSPGSTLPWLSESRLLTSQGKTNDAIDALRAAAQEFDGDADIRSLLAQLYLEAGKVADADRIYWRLYEDAEDLGQKLRWVEQLNQAAELQGTTEQLIEKFQQRQRNNRTSIEPLLALAEIHRANYDYEERRMALLEAARIKPQDLALLHQVARIEESEGDWERALATLERAAKVDTTTGTREKIARLHLNYGDIEKGYALLHELANEKSSGPRSAEAIAEAMISAQDWERAVKFLAEKTAEHENDYRLLYLLAIAREEAGEEREAIDAYLSLLRADKELTGLFGKAPQTPWAAWIGMLSTLLPQDSLDYMELSWLSETVYSHRDRGNNRGFSPYPGAMQQGVVLPHDLAAARKYALIHLLSMAETMYEAELDELKVSLRQHGVANAEVLLALSPDIQNLSGVVEIAEQHPDDKGLMALHVLTMIEPRGGQGNVEMAEKAYQLFKGDRPQLAFMAAVSAGSIDASKTALLDEALAKADAIENPNLFLVMAISTTVGGDLYGGPQPTKLPEAYQQKLTKQLLAWYPKLTNLGPQGFMVFYTVASALGSSEDPTEFLAFVDDEIARWRNSGQSASSMRMMFGGYSEEAFIQPLSFPPQTLSNFPDHVRQLLGGGPNGDPFGGLDVGEKWDEETLLKLLPTIKDPTLRILLAHRHEQDEIAAKALDAMLQSPQPQLDALLMAAAKATDEGDFKTASELLNKSRYLPMTRDLRKRVDAALVAMGTEFDEEAADAEPKAESLLSGGIKNALALLNRIGGDDQPQVSSTVAAAQEAALRLRRANLDSDQRLQLIASMERLGLNDEAEKLESATASLPRVSSGRSYSPTTQTDRIKKLLDEGKRDQAIRMAVNDLTALGRGAASQANAYRNNRYEFRELKSLIQAHNLQQAVLDAMNPGESGSDLKLGQYGFACEVMGDDESAVAAYQAALAKREKNEVLRVRLMLLQMEDDTAAAAKHLALLDLGGQNGESLAEAISDEIAPEAVYRFTHALAEHLLQLKNTDKTDLSWVKNYLSSLGRQQYFRNVRLPSIYATEHDEELNEEAVERMQLRDAAHNALARAMLKIPQLAPDGFTRLLAVAERDDQVTDEFARHALDALLLHKPHQARGGVTYFSSSSYNDNENQVPLRSPQEFLVLHAWRTKTLDSISAETIPALNKANKTEQAEQLERDLSLFACAEEQFVDHAKKAIEQSQAPRRFGPQFSDSAALSKAVEIWKVRELDVDLGPLLIESLEAAVNGYGYAQAPPALTKYTATLARRGERKKVAALLEEITLLFLGPQEQRVELVRENYEPRGVRSGTANAKIHMFVEIMSQLASEPQLVFRSLDIMEACGLSQGGNFRHYVRNSMFSGDGVNADEMMKFLESSPFLGDLDEFRPYLTAEDSPRTMLGGLLLRFRYYGGEKTVEIREKLAARKPATFGAGLMAIYLADNDTAAALEFIAQHEAELKKQPEEKQQQIAKLTQDLIDAADGELKLSDDARRVNQWLQRFADDEDAALVEKILAAKRLEELDIEAYNASSDLARLLPPLVESDPEKAKQVFEKMVALIEKSQTQSRSPYNSQEDVASSLLAEVIQTEQNLSMTAFFIDVVLSEHGKEDGGIQMSRRQSYALDNAVQAAYRQISEQADAEKETRLVAVQRLYARLGEALGERPTSVLVESYRTTMDGLRDEDIDAAIAWADGEAEDGEHPGIARELAAAGRMSMASRLRAREVSAEDEDAPVARAELADYHEHYLALLKDQELPASWRLTIAESLIRFEGGSLPLPAVAACVHVMRDALEADGALTQEHATFLLSQFLTQEQDETWKADATALAAVWNKQMTRSTRNTTYYRGGYYGGRGGSPIEALLKLNLLLDDEQSVARIMQQHEESLANSLPAFTLMVRYGRNAFAGKILRASSDRMAIGQQDEGTVAVYDKKLDAALPAFLKSLPRADLQFAAEAILASLPNTSDPTQRTQSTAAQRAKDVADRFAGVEFQSTALKERTLVTLSSHPESRRVVAEALAAAANDIYYASLLQLEDGALQHRKQSLINAHLRTSMESGDFAPTMEALEDLSGADIDEPYYLRNAFQTMGRLVKEVAAEHWSKWTPEQVGGMLPVTRKLAGLTYDQIGYGPEAIVTMNLFAHALSGKLDELEQWRDALPEERREQLAEQRVGTEIWKLGLQAAGGANEENVDRRVEIAGLILKCAEGQGWLRLSENQVIQGEYGSRLTSSIVYSELLSEEELLEHADELAKQAPAGGLVPAALARLLGQQREYEKSISFWNAALAAAPDDDALRQTQWRMNLAKQLKFLKRPAEAKKLLEELAPEKRHEDLREQYNAQLAKLQEDE